MAKITSNKELLYNSREGKSAIIQIHITEWKFNLHQNNYSAIVNDFAVVDSVLIPINTKTMTYSKVEIDGIFTMLNNPINSNEIFSNELSGLISMALLFETQSKPIYESISTDWKVLL